MVSDPVRQSSTTDQKRTVDDIRFTLTPGVLERYLQRRAQDLAVCRRALSDNDLHSIEVIGHRLKGNAESFGFPELGKLGEQLENDAQGGSRDVLEREIQSLEEWVKGHPTH